MDSKMIRENMKQFPKTSSNRYTGLILHKLKTKTNVMKIRFSEF